MNPTSTEIFATTCFALAILHTFSVKRFAHTAEGYPEGSVAENFFRLLGEVEVVFGFWAAIFVIYFAMTQGAGGAVHYLESLNFTEPAFVFVIMTVCSSKPVLRTAEKLIALFSKLIPIQKPMAFYAACLIVGPILGSFISEPAAMTVTALILLERFYKKGISEKFMYATLGLLFVNVSIGGTLTPYSAPPVLMVAAKWNWDLPFMLKTFGWKAVVAIVATTTFVVVRFRKELADIPWETENVRTNDGVPLWVSSIHILFLSLIVMSSHYLVVFTGIFLFFLGLVSVTKEYQDEIKLREGLLVAFFLGGLVVLGGQQRWWLEPLLTNLDAFPLYVGAIALTAVMDNAALTYLGSQVPSLGMGLQYALVAGAVTGGGLTVIANAPNPAGYGILNRSFGKEGISPLLLLIHALVPTSVAALCFWFL